MINPLSYGAVGDGVHDDTCAIQAAISAASTGGFVLFTPGAAGKYLITGTVNMMPGVTLISGGGVTIVQGNGANLFPMISFNNLCAVNAGLIGLTIDGNRANNTNNNVTMIVASYQSGTTIRNCTFQNMPGMGLMLNGAHPVVEGCMFNSAFSHGVRLQGLAVGSYSGGIVRNNVFGAIGYMCVSVLWSDNNLIEGNQVVSPTLMHVVNTTGSTVNWVSGSNFAQLCDGMFIRIAGSEFQIGTVNSSTNLTLTSSVGVLTGASAVSGGADLINVDTAIGTIIRGNSLFGGMSGGVVVHNFSGGGVCADTVVSDNVIENIGNMGVAITSIGSTSVDNTIVSGNAISDCGFGGAANITNSNAGIWIDGATSYNTTVCSNACRNFAGVMQWGVYIDPSVPSGGVTLRSNRLQGTMGGCYGTDWIPWLPNVTCASGALGYAYAVGRYLIADKTMFFYLTVTIVSNGTAANGIIASLPESANSVLTQMVVGREDAITGNMLQGKIASGASSVLILTYANAHPGANGAVLVVSGTIELGNV